MIIWAGLAASISACAPIRGDHLPTLSEIDVPDRYATAPAGSDAERSCGTGSWPRLFDDAILVNLSERAEDPSVRAEIASTYIALRLAQARKSDAQARIDNLADLQQLASFRARASLVTERDPLQIDAERARIAADLPLQDSAVATGAAHIAALIGATPDEVLAHLALPAAIPTGPANIRIGQPSELRDRRDDLRAAKGRLRTASWPLGPSPAAVTAYRRAFLKAQADVETAVAAFEGANAHEQGLFDALAKSEAVAALARRQYREGLSDYAALSGTEFALMSIRGDLSDARATRANALIRLCDALGRAEPMGAGDGD